MKTFSEFFGFRQTPFKRTPDVEFYYPTKIHQDALDTLFYMLQSDDAFTVITGEPGTGKTITLRKFISELPNNIVFAYILFPSLSPEELFMAILEDFNIRIDKNITKNGLYARLRDFLIEIGAQGKKAMIIIDEAQNMPLETLEELRILSNLETDKEKLLKIVLAGQPELDKKLASEELRQLSQRVTLYCKISNMPDYEIKNYIYYHLSKAGKSSIKIQNNVLKKICKLTQGNPRLINILMERTIIAAFLDNSYTVKDYHLTSAISSVNTIAAALKRQNNSMRPLYIGAAAAVAFVLALGGAYLTLKPSVAPTAQGVAVTAPAPKVAPAPVEVAVAPKKKDDSVVVKPVEKPMEKPVFTEPKSDGTSTNIVVTEREPITNEPIIFSGNNGSSEIVVAPENSMMNAGGVRPAPIPSPTGVPVYNTVTPQAPAAIPDSLAMPIGTRVSVSAAVLTLRSTPSLKAPKIASVTSGQQFMVLAEDDYWVQIESTPGVVGWVYKGYLKALN